MKESVSFLKSDIVKKIRRLLIEIDEINNGSKDRKAICMRIGALQICLEMLGISLKPYRYVKQLSWFGLYSSNRIQNIWEHIISESELISNHIISNVKF